MIDSFENYLKLGKVKRKTPDPEEAKALFEQSKDRMDYVRLKGINHKTAKFVLQDSYEAAREAAQSLMSIHGFKPYSHEATISFIKSFYGDRFNDDDLHKFDHFRRLRNNSVYKAAKIMEEDAKSSILFSKTFINKVQLLLDKRKS
ncbi:hypothetical protein KY358_05005 [Candidatus Woesearchaeota archaeon]|nr:hypothetical protein [Candidatus Woesearchaeota archaeon]